MAGYSLDDYVDVATRIGIFRDQYPEGSLQPVDLAKPFWVQTVGDRQFVCYAAAAYRTPTDRRPGVGVAWEPFPGPTQFTRDSEVMNAETAAWGRAIVAVLAADTKKVASAEEVRNRAEGAPAAEARPNKPASAAATKPQRAKIQHLVNQNGAVPTPWPLSEELTKAEASEIIDWLNTFPSEEPAERVATLRKDADAAEAEFVGAGSVVPDPALDGTEPF